MTARKLAETDAQIQTLRRHVAEQCVAVPARRQYEGGEALGVRVPKAVPSRADQIID